MYSTFIHNITILPESTKHHLKFELHRINLVGRSY
uniref:Uncharacterized protein n=1 Tax=Ciona intestinalis TaxID=7719 RepID=H2XLF8_CIOIN